MRSFSSTPATTPWRRSARLRRIPLAWSRLGFSVKLAAIIAVAGVLIAIIPLSLASRDNRIQSTLRAADKAGIVANLIAGQQAPLVVGKKPLRISDPDSAQLRRSDKLGGLVHEYRLVA